MIQNNQTNIEIKDGRGFAPIPNGGVFTFEVQGFAERESIQQKEYQNLYSRYLSDNMTMTIADFTVPVWGNRHNLYPQEVFSITSQNKLLPEVIKKQVKFLFGKGPRLYQEVISGEGENQRRVRIPVDMPAVDEWLDTWEEQGVENVWDYLKNRIVDFYYVNTCCSRWHFNTSRRSALNFQGSHKVRALSYVGADEARLATREKGISKRIKNADCKYVIIADWLNPNKYDYQVYHRFTPADPFRYNTAVSFESDKTFTKWIYAFNDWFEGLLEWIKASNLSPKYLNSYLKNALNAHIHVIIPGTWYNAQIDILQRICAQNLEGEAPVQTEYKGVKLVNEKGAPIPFYETMIDEVIANELRMITSLMSGEGKNQGKLWASTKWGEEGWEFKEFPGKFKEFFDTVISYDKRADQVTLAGKGVPPSISGVDKDGSISNSGSEVYYNYLIYVASLVWDEYFVMKDLNRALHLNFPETKKKKIKFGFWIDIPAKLQDTPPSQRPQQTATADNQTNIEKTQEQ
ncbi:hypothetical protein D0T49_01915 [Paludibacter sp. 221]|uniref:hypothetical protein n=1 Tax=Paludibacter sp. 221 TaxID=2302939 RepID=UPI0013D76FE0|nr:hypothetical protein [Paludibacter sp. 221]NDV45806.1 hypothetical protein [Paludibacter sp. 221]